MKRKSKKESGSKQDTTDRVDLTKAEKIAAKERAMEILPDEVGEDFDADMKGLEPLADKLNDAQKRILEVIITDIFPETETECEKDVFKRLRNSCDRAGMLEDQSAQRMFFRTLADPGFQHVVKSVGNGLIGLHVVPIVQKCIELALEGDKTCLKWALEIIGMKQSKYDFYLDRRQQNQLNIVNKGHVDFTSEMSTRELRQLASSIHDD